MIVLKTNEKDSLSIIHQETTLIFIMLGLICNIMQPLIYIAPIKCFVQMIKTRNIDKVPFLYFIFNLSQSLIWIIIACKKLDYALLSANVICAFFFGIFCVGYFILSNFEFISIFVKFNTLVFSIIILIFMLDNYINYTLLAITAIILESTCYLSTLQHIKLIFDKKDNSYIDFPITVSIFIVCQFWILYSIFNHNYVLLIPNVIGLIVSTGLLYVNYYFGSIKKEKEIIKRI